MSYCYQRSINYSVMGIITWCGRQNIQQRGGILKAPSQVPIFFQNIITFEVLVDAQMIFWIFYITPKFKLLDLC